MSAVIVRGESQVHDHHSGGGSAGDVNGSVCTFVRQGRLQALRAEAPEPGKRWNGKGTVIDWEIAPQRGGFGLMTVRCAGEAGEDQEEVEIDSVQLEKPIMSHRKFRAFAEEIEKWRESDAETRAAMQYMDGETARSLSATARKAAKLILEGVESYLEFVPVVRRTTTRTDTGKKWHEIGADCGRRKNPPGGTRAKVGGSWKWLKTADRVVIRPDKTSVRMEEWTGAEKWDTDLYDN